MLSEDKITETEAVYISIDSGMLTDEIIFELRDNIYNANFEQHCYLEWLLIRWTILRKNPQHLPKRIVKLDTSIKNTTHKKIKFKPGDWLCNICNDHQFANNKYCRMCNTDTIRLK